MVETYRSADALLSRVNVDGPVVAIRPHRIERRAEQMLAAFPGDVLYAVKCNDHPIVLQALWRGGVRHFDTASIAEVRLVRGLLPDATCHFMHPVKSREAIVEAYEQHGVRAFVVDHVEELDKLLVSTGDAGDLEVVVRIAVPGDGAVLTLTGKFGASIEDAVELVRLARVRAARVGLTFHVGSQCLDPQAYVRALELCAAVVRYAGAVDVIDIGGGFPARYRGDEPLFEAFVAAVRGAVARFGLTARLQCEPGRLLVADGASVLTRVELRRGTALHLNDGVYGNLAELKWIGPCFPLRRVGSVRPEPEAAFDLFGPTCDSIDSMPGPHVLPADTKDGDWIEVGLAGAYSNALSTRFNGFGEGSLALLADDGPMPLSAEATRERIRLAA